MRQVGDADFASRSARFATAERPYAAGVGDGDRPGIDPQRRQLEGLVEDVHLAVLVVLQAGQAVEADHLRAGLVDGANHELVVHDRQELRQMRLVGVEPPEGLDDVPDLVLAEFGYLIGHDCTSSSPPSRGTSLR